MESSQADPIPLPGCLVEGSLVICEVTLSYTWCLLGAQAWGRREGACETAYRQG